MKKTFISLALLLMSGFVLAQGEFVCGDTVRDGNGNEYATVRIGALCWTTSNMRAVSYADGTPIAKAMIYNSERYNDTVANLANFGRLYTWWSAVNLPEGSTDKPAKDADGFVQGVCPEGWHIPTVSDMYELRNYPEESLHSADFWVQPNANTNSTGFSEVPAGRFSAEFNRFDGLFTNSYIWTDSASSSEWVVACNSRYFCDYAREEQIKKSDALSVRCVLNYGPLPESCPIVSTDTAFVSSSGNLKFEGHVEDLHGTVESSGFIYGSRKSSLTDTVVNKSGNSGFIEAEINGLYPCDSIFYVAFLKSSRCTETVYGDTLFIRVPSSISNFPNCGVVYDHEGNKYNTVIIGEQCWTRENMRCKTSPKGTPIPCGNSVYHNFNQPYYFNNTRSQIPDTLKGLLYNWPATLDTSFTAVAHVSFTNRRGICPEGWHVPSDAEWTILENYLQSSDCYVCGENVNAITKALSYNKYWNSNSNDCTPGNDLQSNNSSGFSAMPTGRWERFENNADVFNYINWGSWFWSSTSHLHDNAGDHHYARSRSWWTGDHKIGWYFSGKQVGQAVRCLKDTPQYCPTVTTGAASAASDSSMTLKGVVSNLTGTVESSGFVYGSSMNALTTTVANSSGTDTALSATISGLALCETIYYAAFTKSSDCPETKYGDTLFYMLSPEIQNCGTVTDIDSNTYSTVKIGEQCWMRENLRTKRYADGRTLVNGGLNYSNYTNPYYYNYESSSIPLKERGLLYNWQAAMDTTFSQAELVSFENRQGICPDGWHVPSDAEWTILTDYLILNKVCYACSQDKNTIAKSLASKECWNEYTSSCSAGNSPEENNLTEFNAIPAGARYGSSFDNSGNRAVFLSSTSQAQNYIWLKVITYNDSYVLRQSGHKRVGYSVRCLKDAP